MREVCGELLDPHVGEQSFDYVQEFSAVLPPTMISTLLGVPEQDREYLRGVVDDIFHIEEGAVGMVNDVGDQGPGGHEPLPVRPVRGPQAASA